MSIFKQRRKMGGYTQAQLAKYLGCSSQTTISMFETGARVLPSKYRTKAAAYYNMSISEFELEIEKMFSDNFRGKNNGSDSIQPYRKAQPSEFEAKIKLFEDPELPENSDTIWFANGATFPVQEAMDIVKFLEFNGQMAEIVLSFDTDSLCDDAEIEDCEGNEA